MRKLILILIAILPNVVYSQIDSTTIYYKWIENNDIANICDVSDIQIQKIFCKDKTLKGKVFNFIIKEFKKGKIVSVDNLEVSAETKRIPMVVNGDTAYYVIDYTNKTGFGKKTDSLTISFIGKLNKNKFRLKIDYPGMSFIRELKGTDKYSLRAANSCSGSKISVPVGGEHPLIAYTTPFDTGVGLNSYCLLGEENVFDWYDKFKVKHYYVIFIEIK
jgi:hypothetical protein